LLPFHSLRSSLDLGLAFVSVELIKVRASVDKFPLKVVLKGMVELRNLLCPIEWLTEDRPKVVFGQLVHSDVSPFARVDKRTCSWKILSGMSCTSWFLAYCQWRSCYPLLPPVVLWIASSAASACSAACSDFFCRKIWCRSFGCWSCWA